MVNIFRPEKMKLVKTTVIQHCHYNYNGNYFRRMSEFTVPEDEDPPVKWFIEIDGMSWEPCEDPFFNRPLPEVADRIVTEADQYVDVDDKIYIREWCSSPAKITWYERKEPLYAWQSDGDQTWMDAPNQEELESQFQKELTCK